jgi:hypothetical protein
LLAAMHLTLDAQVIDGGAPQSAARSVGCIAASDTSA